MSNIKTASILFGRLLFFEKNNKPLTIKPWMHPKRIMVLKKLAMINLVLQLKIYRIKLSKNYVLKTLKGKATSCEPFSCELKHIAHR